MLGTGKKQTREFDWKIVGFALLMGLGVFLVAFGSIKAAQACGSSKKTSTGNFKWKSIPLSTLKSTQIIPSPTPLGSDKSKDLTQTQYTTSIKRLGSSKDFTINPEETSLHSLIKLDKSSNLNTEFERMPSDNAPSQGNKSQLQSSSHSLKKAGLESFENSFEFSSNEPIQQSFENLAGFPQVSGIFSGAKKGSFKSSKSLSKKK